MIEPRLYKITDYTIYKNDIKSCTRSIMSSNPGIFVTMTNISPGFDSCHLNMLSEPIVLPPNLVKLKHSRKKQIFPATIVVTVVTVQS